MMITTRAKLGPDAQSGRFNTLLPAGQDDIGGGCGQLWFVQDWMRKNPELAKPSKGHGLPKVHTPQLA